MKLKAALLAVMLGLAPLSHGAVVDPAEPPATPAGGNPEGGIGVGGAVGIAIAVGVLAAIIAGDDDDNTTTTTTTTTTSSR